MVDWRARKRLVLDAFVFANLAFLALDIYVAHSTNGFAAAAEWVPLAFSVAGALAVGACLHPRPVHAGRVRRAVINAVGLGAVVVGVAGMILHLDSHFFEQQTVKNLVYTAPFAAPLAYTGLGLLVLMNRTVPEEGDEWGRWVVVLALGGFAGNFVLSLCDHAQNGFFHATEWIPVFAAALGVGFLTVAGFGRPGRQFYRVCLAVLGGEAIVGVIGFMLHASASMQGTGVTFFDRVVFGPPIFAPLLFANLALLGALGVADCSAHPRATPARAR